MEEVKEGGIEEMRGKLRKWNRKGWKRKRGKEK